MKTFQYNAETGEVIERNLTEQELAQIEIDEIESAAQKAAYEAKVQEKAALLKRLGITADEAVLLLS